MASQIPGYYFDEDKRKYFKVLPNHQAPQGAKYSKEALKTAAKKQKKKHSLHVDADKSSRFQASPILAHSLGGALCLRRELGVNPHRAGEAVYDAWASGLERTTYIRALQNILSFAIDKETGASLMTFNSLGGEPGYLHVQMPNTSPNDGCLLFSVKDTLLTSINVSPSRFAIATFGDRDTSTIAITKLLDKDAFLECYQSTTGIMPNRGQSWLVYSHQCLVTAAKPDPTSTIFVAGGSSGTFVIREIEGGWNTKRHQPGSAKEVTSVDWLDHNTYLTGERSGAVRLWDIRNDGMSLRFQFPAAINHVKKLREQRIVVAGLENNLLSYDLRSAPTFVDGMSLPYMTFDTYRNWDHNAFSASVDVHENLIAASTDDKQVQLFNGTTGREMQIGPSNGFANLQQQAMCLRPTTGENGSSSTPRLYVANGPTVEQWAW